MKALEGFGVALVTPFTDKGAIDTNAIHALVDHCVDGGVDYLVVLGTTGEPATLDHEEKKEVLEEVVTANADRLPLVIGIGGNNTLALAEELQATDLSPFAAVLSVSPYYNRPTQDGIIKHYQVLAKASPLPIIIYNVPARTGSNVLPETIIKLAYSCPNILGVKEACGDMQQIQRIIDGKPEQFMVISGDDGTALSTVLAGGVGVISVLGQGIPKAFATMIRLGREGAVTKSRSIEDSILPGIDLIFEEGNPAGIKALLHHKGICGPDVRLPLVPATVSLHKRIAAYLQQFTPVDIENA